VHIPVIDYSGNHCLNRVVSSNRLQYILKLFTSETEDIDKFPTWLSQEEAYPASLYCYIFYNGHFVEGKNTIGYG
jgi:hypothetical protein